MKEKIKNLIDYFNINNPIFNQLLRLWLLTLSIIFIMAGIVGILELLIFTIINFSTISTIFWKWLGVIFIWSLSCLTLVIAGKYMFILYKKVLKYVQTK